jgi:hypothetical protein
MFGRPPDLRCLTRVGGGVFRHLYSEWVLKQSLDGVYSVEGGAQDDIWSQNLRDTTLSWLEGNVDALSLQQSKRVPRAAK